MERLTVKDDGHYAPRMLCSVNRFGEVDDRDSCAEYCNEVLSCENGGCAIQACFDRLGAYENMWEKITKRIGELKGSSNYPHFYKGQMVEDFEWVLSLLKSEGTPAVYNTGKMYTCNCTGCRHDGSDECMHCMRAYSDCYESA